ncbi:hypothetical protein V8J82_07385 [Gymnodinialimonas sp. 2305UL16-5]|uniref:hypothetical protein n=1 Tax=Gymnodinialimonas mytili TaxID=3126503 RepID=UPI0030AE90EA
MTTHTSTLLPAGALLMLSLVLSACSPTGYASDGCSQLELGAGMSGAECGVSTTSELAAIHMD